MFLVFTTPVVPKSLQIVGGIPISPGICILMDPLSDSRLAYLRRLWDEGRGFKPKHPRSGLADMATSGIAGTSVVFYHCNPTKDSAARFHFSVHLLQVYDGIPLFYELNACP